jgi:hypothetical protein
MCALLLRGRSLRLLAPSPIASPRCLSLRTWPNERLARQKCPGSRAPRAACAGDFARRGRGSSGCCPGRETGLGPEGACRATSSGFVKKRLRKQIADEELQLCCAPIHIRPRETGMAPMDKGATHLVAATKERVRTFIVPVCAIT